jgi:phthalate 4,5-cis-dihydrodiol dehydrogenase
VSARALRIGVAGLGRAFTLMLPTFRLDPRVRLVAAADPSPAARRQFEADFGGRSHTDVAALCADADVDVVYIATPHELHAEHALLAFAQRKHVLVEKPLAVTIADCTRMIDAADAAGRYLVVGHSHSFDGPVLRVRELIGSGEFGAVRMIHAFYATDYLYRPRRPEELRTADGGGVIYSQAVHQLDVVRLLGGGLVRWVRAQTGAWDAARRTEGAYSALLIFTDGAFASVTYSGYAHYDGDELADNVSEMGLPKAAADYGAARRRLAAAAPGASESALKAARNYGGSAYARAADSPPPAHQHFGHVLVCCDGGDLRPTPHGVAIYGDGERRFEPLPPPAVPRAEVIDELWSAVIDDRPPLHDGRWARATLEACVAMLDSARDSRDVALHYQTAPVR